MMIKFSTLLLVLSAVSFPSSAIEPVKPNVPQLPACSLGQVCNSVPRILITPDVGGIDDDIIGNLFYHG